VPKPQIYVLRKLKNFAVLASTTADYNAYLSITAKKLLRDSTKTIRRA
jgi:hypothetical protein